MKPLNIVRNNIRQKARRCGVTEAAMTQVYLQERLIARVAHSEYGRNLILKGGLCMAMILGVHSRTTMDSDYNLKGIKLSEKGMRFDPGVTQQIHLINQVRISSVHKKQDTFYPTSNQSQAMILFTIDTLQKLFQ